MTLFTLEEARALLPRLQPMLEQLQEAAQELRKLETMIATQRRVASGDGNLLADPFQEGERPTPLDRARQRTQEQLEAINALGVEVKDPERGLIDFRHERNGEVVYLCYLLGEPDIQYWHGLEAGFAGRQPLDK